MKNTILYVNTILFLLTNSAMAYPDTFQFYGGVNVAATSSKTDIKTISRTPFGHLGIKTKSSSQFLSGGAFVGFRYFMEKIFAGFELEGMKGGETTKTKPLDPVLGVPWTLELKRNHHIIGSATVGWEETRQLIFYAKLGLGLINFDFVEGREQPSFNKVSQNVVYFVPAFGGEYNLHENIALRLELAAEIAGQKIKSDSKVAANISQDSKASYQSVSIKFGFLVKV